MRSKSRADGFVVLDGDHGGDVVVSSGEVNIKDSRVFLYLEVKDGSAVVKYEEKVGV